MATSSSDCTAKLWKIPNDNFTESLTKHHAQICALSKRIERVLWHPCACGIIATASSHSVMVYDVEANKRFFGKFVVLFHILAFEKKMFSWFLISIQSLQF